MGNRSLVMGFALGAVMMASMMCSCAHDEVSRSGASEGGSTAPSGESVAPAGGSDFSPEYRQQLETAERDAEIKKQSKKKRDRRIDDIINRSDRREN